MGAVAVQVTVYTCAAGTERNPASPCADPVSGCAPSKCLYPTLNPTRVPTFNPTPVGKDNGLSDKAKLGIGFGAVIGFIAFVTLVVAIITGCASKNTDAPKPTPYTYSKTEAALCSATGADHCNCD